MNHARAGLKSALLALFALAATIHVHASTLDATSRTDTLEIQSEVLGESRRVVVQKPGGYDPSSSYPTVYVLDAEWNFNYVAAYLDNLAENEVYPPMLVTGIVNVNRNRDYVPRADAHFRDTGQADKFLEFVEKEWIARIESEYAANGRRVLIGHSFGGVFALHTLFRQPELFDAYLAFGSSAWIADRVLFEEATAYFESEGPFEKFVWMTVGEGDGGPTVPSSKDLAAVFELEAPGSLEWTFSVTPRTDHFTNFISVAHDAFMALFPAWEFKDELALRAKLQGADGVNGWFEEKESALGWRFSPAWFDLGVTALSLSRDPQTAAAARALTAKLRRHYPHNAFIALYSASVYENTQMYEEALAQTERAISLVNEQKLDPNELSLDGLVEKRQRIEDLMAQ